MTPRGPHRFAPLLALVLGLSAAAVMASTSQEAAPSARPALGDTAPGFALPATDGSSLDLESLRGKERAVVVFFRGSW